MKKSVRNSILTILCGAMIAAAGSCSLSQTYPVTVDGQQIRAGLYILEQQEALSEAVSKLKEEQPDIDTSAEGFSYLDQTVEGKKFADWVNDKAIEKCREYIAVNRLFDQYGLSLTAEEIKSINDNVKSIWTEENMYAQYFYGVDIVGEYYETLGVGEQSYKDFQTTSQKDDKLFEHLYGEGGQLAATQDEINNSLNTDYLAVNYFPYDLENGSGAQSYADRIANGESYEEVYRDYAQALNDEEEAAAAAEAAAEAAEAAESEDAAAEGETTDAAADDETADTTAEEETAASTTVEVAEKDSLIQIIKKSSAYPSEEFVNQVSAMNAGDVKVITVQDEDDSHVYVVQKLDILAHPDKTEETVNTVRTDLKTDEYKEMLRSTGAGYSLTTDGSINLYPVKKLIDN
ncbi:MAG: hypothetical protein IK093_20250 [Ruminiclostridium sp.]|nr:hypothetical protein [Ruminiclostridium sp.]